MCPSDTRAQQLLTCWRRDAGVASAERMWRRTCAHKCMCPPACVGPRALVRVCLCVGRAGSQWRCQHAHDGTRIDNLLLRREAPYPLGHTGMIDGQLLPTCFPLASWSQNGWCVDLLVRFTGWLIVCERVTCLMVLIGWLVCCLFVC